VPQYIKLGLICVLLAISSTVMAKIQLQLQGLSGELQANVNVRLAAVNTETVENIDDLRLRARIINAITQGLRPLGYYQPEIEFLPPDPHVTQPERLVVKVSPGMPIKIAGIHVEILGEGRKDSDLVRLEKKSLPAMGSVLNHADYDDFKKALSGVALRKGYFDAQLRKSQLGVLESQHQAFWDIVFDTGPRYRFGATHFSGSQIRQDYLQQLVPFHEGDEYDAGSLAEFNRRLAATNWFNSAVVSPDFSHGTTDKILPLNAVLSPRSQNSLETGVGYSTDVGPRVTTSWKKPWVNSRGQSLESSLSLSAPEQSLDFSYKVPLLVSPIEQYYLFQAGFKREDLNDTQSDSSTLNVARYWQLSDGWQRAVNLRWGLDHFTQALVTNTTMLIYPGITFNRARQRGGLMPFWGDSQRYSLDVSDTSWGSDVNFFVIQAQNVWIRSWNKKHRFVMRTNLGWIETDNFDKVPPSLRFFAGGDRSIRGYSYKSISPRDADDKLTGASKLATASLEYQYNITGKWWSAVFVDSGEAVNNIRDSNIKTGSGIGVRWASPIGPVKFDIAMPVGDSDHRGLQFYIGLGPEL
jgi:translocation and assembly module TamA